MTYDYGSRTVSLELDLTFEATSAWDGLEMTIRIPPSTRLDLSHLNQGFLTGTMAYAFGSEPSSGRVVFATVNLTGPSTAPPLGKPGDLGTGLHWNLAGQNVTLRTTISLDESPQLASVLHQPTVYTSDDILRRHSIEFLFVTVDAASDIQRFDRQPLRFVRVYANAATVIFGVL